MSSSYNQCYYCGNFISPGAGKYALIEPYKGDTTFYEVNGIRVPGITVIEQSNKRLHSKNQNQIVLVFNGYWSQL